MSDELEQLRRQADDRRDAIANDVELVTDRVAPSRIADRQKARFSERVGSVRSSVFGSADSSTNRLSGTDSDPSMSDRASGAVDSVKEKTPDSVAGFTEGNPLAAGLIGLGVGLLAATLIPETREERKIAGKVQGHVDDAAAQIASAGQQVAENVQPAAQEAAQKVKESATDSADSVKGDAQDAASSAKTDARAEAKDAASSD